MNYLSYISFGFFLLLSNAAGAQYAPPAGYPGTTAIHKDSANWVCWANASQVQLGFQDISNSTSPYANTGTTADALGPAGEGGIISLGDGGNIVLTFPYPIRDGAGPDFAVFENGFNNSFLELAFVEVSSDGLNFVRFPAFSETDTMMQVNSFGSVDATKIHNLAGKYRANYGTPFDLADLADSSNLDIQQVTHLRLVDVVGSIDPAYAGRDSRGYKVNDPWPTPFDSGGFDLDAVGVLNASNLLSSKKVPTSSGLRAFPNPASKGQDQIRIEFTNNQSLFPIQVYNLQGQLYFSQEIYSGQSISTKNWPSGIYLLQLDRDIVKIETL